MIKLGIIGSGRIANRFVPEAANICEIEVCGVYNPHLSSAKEFAKKHLLQFATDQLAEMFCQVDAVYIATPHSIHDYYIREALQNKKHVLCEKPMVLTKEQAVDVYGKAKRQQCILMEGIKTAYAPGFIQILKTVKSGIIGKIVDVEAAFTKLVAIDSRELTDVKSGGSFTELGTYPMLPIFEIMGTQYKNLRFESVKGDNGLDVYTKAYFEYENGFATAKTGLGVKSDGQLLISGTKGYIRAQAPWWLTKSFEICFEDSSKNQIIDTVFEGDGLRYEIRHFAENIMMQNIEENTAVSITMAAVMEQFYIKA